MFIFILIGFIILQRLSELIIAKRNEKWMKDRGAEEYGKKHYKFMVMIHIFFFVSLLAEGLTLHTTISAFWPVLVLLFAGLQFARVWIIRSLGRFWNTKIIILPGAELVSKGPYKWVRHPNYIVVTLELLVIPLLFNAYITCIVFLLLNQLILLIRISEEERALEAAADYNSVFAVQKKWFLSLKIRR